MASSGDIETVRINTNERDETVVTDASIGLLIDSFGITGASAQLWGQKAARLAEEVNVSEAGASHSFSDLFKHAKEMALLWRNQYDLEVVTTTGRVRVKVIDRQ